jgi:hypothetical protein
LTRSLLLIVTLTLLICAHSVAQVTGAPSLAFSSYLGGTSFDEALAITTDSAGNIYTAGLSDSPVFPGTHKKLVGTEDLFVSKFSPGGTLLSSTRVGGGKFTQAFAIAVDQSGNAYVTGQTASRNLKIVNGFQGTYGGGFVDAFIVKIAPSGTVVYSSFIGGSGGTEAGFAIAVDALGTAYVVGGTNSKNFPLKNAFQPIYGGGSNDAFLVKISTTTQGADSLLYSSYLGGSGPDVATGVAIDAQGNIYLSGSAGCCFPTTPDAYQTFIGNVYSHAFIAKLASDGSVKYSTLFGGSQQDDPRSMVIDQSGTVYIAGESASPDLPMTASAFQNMNHGSLNGFLLKFDPAIPGSNALQYSSYIGGENIDSGAAIAIDSGGHMYVAGYTSSQAFPTKNAIQTQLAGGRDAFVAALDPTISGSAGLLFGTYLGGSNEDQATGIALMPNGLVAFAGYTDAPFPLYKPYQPLYGGSRDAFVAAIAFNPAVLSSTALAASPNPSASGHTVQYTAAVSVGGAAMPSGTVTFMEGAKLIGTATLVNRQASIRVLYKIPGTHSIITFYSGDANYIDSRSGTWTQVVQ